MAVHLEITPGYPIHERCPWNETIPAKIQRHMGRLYCIGLRNMTVRTVMLATLLSGQRCQTGYAPTVTRMRNSDNSFGRHLCCKSAKTPINTIMDVAEWPSESTFRQFYDKPIQIVVNFGDKIILLHGCSKQ